MRRILVVALLLVLVTPATTLEAGPDDVYVRIVDDGPALHHHPGARQSLHGL